MSELSKPVRIGARTRGLMPRYKRLRGARHRRRYSNPNSQIDAEPAIADSSVTAGGNSAGLRLG